MAAEFHGIAGHEYRCRINFVVEGSYDVDITIDDGDNLTDQIMEDLNEANPDGMQEIDWESIRDLRLSSVEDLHDSDEPGMTMAQIRDINVRFSGDPGPTVDPMDQEPEVNSKMMIESVIEGLWIASHYAQGEVSKLFLGKAIVDLKRMIGVKP